MKYATNTPVPESVHTTGACAGTRGLSARRSHKPIGQISSPLENEKEAHVPAATASRRNARERARTRQQSAATRKKTQEQIVICQPHRRFSHCRKDRMSQATGAKRRSVAPPSG